MTAPPFLDVEDVTKSYGHTTVLDRISLSVPKHTTTCLIGASGSGKSTLLRCINGLEPIQGGRIMFEEDQISGPGVDIDYVRRNIGMVFQGYNLFPNMSVMENVALGPRKVLGLGRKAAEQRARELLGRIGLAKQADSYPDKLSGGQQQRVAIVRAMAMETKVLLLDEITAALDPELVGEVLRLIRELGDNGMTMILATHEMAFAREVANTVCFLDAGRILEQGPPEQIFSDPKEERTQAFLKRILEAGRL